MGLVYKTCVIVNPFSGAGKVAKNWPKIKKQLEQAIGDFQVCLSQYPGHATHLTRAAITDGYNRIVSVGGDGTLSQVVNGFFSEDGHKNPLNPSAELGVIAVGTGCDTARTLNIGQSINEQIAVIKSGDTSAVDLGRVEACLEDGRPSVNLFINMCSFGLSAKIVEQLNKQSIGKAVSGRFSYLFGAMKALFNNNNQIINLRINGDSEQSYLVALVGVANGCFCGGGVHLAPMARVSDGELDAIIIGDVGLLDLLIYMRRLFAGKHMTHPKISHQKLAKLVASNKHKDDQLTPVEADGEFVGYLPCQIDIMARSINVLQNKEEKS